MLYKYTCIAMYLYCIYAATNNSRLPAPQPRPKKFVVADVSVHPLVFYSESPQ